jgi:short-subunit dehydrogenase
MNVAREGQGRTALITGASAGIGMALARVFAAHGFDCVLTARRTERLEALAKELHHTHGVATHVITADLAKPQSCGEIVMELNRRAIAVDALVNNAGYGVTGLYRNTAWELQRDFLQVLVTAPSELTHRLLPAMHARGYGRIMNVASVAGLVPGSASHTLYGAAKAMLISFTQALHSEQEGTGVYVSALCPGFTYSEFHDVNGTRAGMRRMPKFMWLAADRVAEDGYRALMRNETICIPGAQYKAISTLVRLLPMSLAYRIGHRRSRRMHRGEA